MEILDAVDVASSIHSEGDPVQAAMAHHTGEAVGVVRLPRGSEDPLHDGLCTDTALLQCFLQRKHTQQTWAPSQQDTYKGQLGWRLLLVCLEALGTFFSFLLDKAQYSQQLSKSMITAPGLGQAFRRVWEHKPEPSLSSSDKWSEMAHQVGYLRYSSFCSQEHVKEGVVQPTLLGFCLWTVQSEWAFAVEFIRDKFHRGQC